MHSVPKVLECVGLLLVVVRHHRLGFELLLSILDLILLSPEVVEPWQVTGTIFNYFDLGTIHFLGVGSEHSNLHLGLVSIYFFGQQR